MNGSLRLIALLAGRLYNVYMNTDTYTVHPLLCIIRMYNCTAKLVHITVTTSDNLLFSRCALVVFSVVRSSVKYIYPKIFQSFNFM